MKTVAFDQPKPVKIPGPDRAITIEASPARVVVTVAGRVVAIKDHLAFYPDRVESIEQRAAA